MDRRISKKFITDIFTLCQNSQIVYAWLRLFDLVSSKPLSQHQIWEHPTITVGQRNLQDIHHTRVFQEYKTQGLLGPVSAKGHQDWWDPDEPDSHLNDRKQLEVFSWRRSGGTSIPQGCPESNHRLRDSRPGDWYEWATATETQGYSSIKDRRKSLPNFYGYRSRLADGIKHCVSNWQWKRHHLLLTDGHGINILLWDCQPIKLWCGRK